MNKILTELEDGGRTDNPDGRKRISHDLKSAEGPGETFPGPVSLTSGVCEGSKGTIAETENGKERALELISALASCDFSSFPSSLRSGFMPPSCRSCSQKLIHTKVT